MEDQPNRKLDYSIVSNEVNTQYSVYCQSRDKTSNGSPQPRRKFLWSLTPVSLNVELDTKLMRIGVSGGACDENQVIAPSDRVM